MTKRLLIALFTAATLLPAYAQPPFSDEATEEFEDIYVFMRIDRIGAYEISAIFSYETERLYLPVTELFRVLQINHQHTFFFDTISGFFLDENLRYLIDYPGKKIVLGQQVFQLDDADMLRTLNGLFLYVGQFGPVFGLHTTFSFRSLSVQLRTDHELPAIRDMRLEQMRQNVERLRGEVQVDTTLQRNYHLLRGGMIDWGVTTTTTDNRLDDARVALAIGTELLGGEANIFLNYSSRDGFDERRQQYQWRWVNNQARLVRQVRAGKLSTSAISSLFAPMLGVSATNTPSSFRRSFGQYTLTDFTNPGWTVELYVNNVLVDYQVADASGYFSFDVPLIYGTTQVELKFYGPYGEERSREQFMNIPFNFIPKGEFEYTLTGGMVQDQNNTLFARGIFNYGLTRHLTFGGGMEYLSDKPSAGMMPLPGDSLPVAARPIEIPFVHAAASLFGRLLLSAEYAHGVRTRGQLSLRLPSNLVLDVDYALFEEGQQAIRFNYLEERKATLAIPVQLGRYRAQIRTGFRQNVYRAFVYNSADLLLSTSFGRFSTTLSGFATWIDQRTPYISSTLAMGVRLPKNFMLRPQAQFDLTTGTLTNLRAELEKRIGRTGFLSLGYEENSRIGLRSVNFGLRFDLNFMQTHLNARVGNQGVVTSQGVRGSMAMGSGNGYLHADNRSMVGRGGITIIPFVDINHNGSHDAGEPLATGLNVRLNGGRVLKSTSDSLIRVTELEPYTSYLMQLDESSLENITWRLTHKTKSIYIDPNQFKRVEIPVLPMGEASGTVQIMSEGRLRTVGRVLVNFFHSDGRLLAQTMTEPDGYFIYMQFPPGSYYASLDPVQLQRMQVYTEEERIEFEIVPDAWGDIVYGLEFILHRVDETTGEADGQTTGDQISDEEVSDEQTEVPQVVPDLQAYEEEVRLAMEVRLQRALRLFVEAQHAALRGDRASAMDLTDQSLAQLVTGQALALKGSLYYMAGDAAQAREYWLQARTLLPDLVFPGM